jgi:DNA invertase Pin-like site-specific DNA recombinase
MDMAGDYARPVKQLILLVEELKQRGVCFRSLTDNIDTQTTAGRFFFHVMASLAEMERELIIERTQAGLRAAKVMGRTGGRKRLMTESKIESAKKLLASGVPAREVAANLGISILPSTGGCLLHRKPFQCNGLCP